MLALEIKLIHVQTYIQKNKTEINEKGFIYLKIKVIPKSNQTEFRELMTDETLKVSVKAPPTEGKANDILGKFLKKEFQASEVSILSGKTDRVKLVKLVK